MSLGEFEIPTFENSVRRLDQPSQYLIKKAKFRPDGYETLQKSMKSCTLYIGKLSTDTTEEQLYELFAKCGIIKQIIMGLDRFKNTPCGFCFIIYQDAKSALSAMKYLNQTMLDGSKIEIDLDPGFVEGRQFGRGADGGQFKKSQYGNSRGGYNRNNGNYRGSQRGRFTRQPARSGVFPDRRFADSYVNSSQYEDVPPHLQQQPPRRPLEPRSGTLPPTRSREGVLQRRDPREQAEEKPPHLQQPAHDNDGDDDMQDDELPPHLR